MSLLETLAMLVLGERQPGGQSGGGQPRLETIRSVTPRHFNFPKKLSNYELF